MHIIHIYVYIYSISTRWCEPGYINTIMYIVLLNIDLVIHICNFYANKCKLISFTVLCSNEILTKPFGLSHCLISFYFGWFHQCMIWYFSVWLTYFQRLIYLWDFTLFAILFYWYNATINYHKVAVSVIMKYSWELHSIKT